MTRILLFALLGAEPSWEVHGTTDGVSVFTRSVVGERTAEIKATATTTAAPQRVCDAAFGAGELDPNEPEVTQRKVVASTVDSRVTYEQITLPVVSNRDYTVKTVRQALDHGGCQITFSIANELGPPVQAGFVRVTKLDGRLTAVPGEDGLTHATYLVFTDPGGAVPAALIE